MTDEAAHPRWMPWPGADLAWRVLGQGCVVHHALSNDTHVLAAWIAPLLEALTQSGGATALALAQISALDVDHVHEALDELHRLRLVRPC